MLKTILKSYGVVITAAVVLAFSARTYVFEAYRIPTDSMRPTLESGDTIFVLKSKYKLKRRHVPERGEVVIFSLETPVRGDFIKRVIAIPGDRVEIRSGEIWVNEKPLKVEFEKDALCGKEWSVDGRSYSICRQSPPIDPYGPRVVGPNEVFVLGDLRSKTSNDALIQTWGAFPIDRITGTAKWVWVSVEPETRGTQSGSFSRLRFGRMLRRIE